MSRIAPSSTGRTPMERLMGHAPHILAPWTKLEDAFFASRTFSPALLEQVRRTLALAHGGRYCQAKGGPPDHSHADSRTAAAVELAEHFARDHRSIDDAVLAGARDHFADAELCELIMFMGFMWAGGTFGAVLGLEPSAQRYAASTVMRHEKTSARCEGVRLSINRDENEVARAYLILMWNSL